MWLRSSRFATHTHKQQKTQNNNIIQHLLELISDHFLRWGPGFTASTAFEHLMGCEKCQGCSLMLQG